MRYCYLQFTIRIPQLITVVQLQCEYIIHYPKIGWYDKWTDFQYQIPSFLISFLQFKTKIYPTRDVKLVDTIGLKTFSTRDVKVFDTIDLKISFFWIGSV